jgi:hypothetical protein
VDIHRADKAYRKRSLWLLLAIVVMCGVLLWELQSWLRSLTQELDGRDPQTVRHWVRLLLVGLGFCMAIPALGLAVSLRRLAAAVRNEGRFPPADWKTLRDVRILRGPAAATWARRVGMASSAAIAVAGLFLGWAAWAWFHFA